jgi:putative Mn2+ efflux pump MntP
MGLFEWAERRTRALIIWDIGALKVCCVLLGMVVGAYIPGFVRDHLWWFLAPTLLLGVGVTYRWLTADPR